jgi:hypothetical protein
MWSGTSPPPGWTIQKKARPPPPHLAQTEELRCRPERDRSNWRGMARKAYFGNGIFAFAARTSLR